MQEHQQVLGAAEPQRVSRVSPWLRRDDDLSYAGHYSKSGFVARALKEAQVAQLRAASSVPRCPWRQLKAMWDVLHAQRRVPSPSNGAQWSRLSQRTRVHPLRVSCLGGRNVRGNERQLCSGLTIRSHLSLPAWSANSTPCSRVSHCGRAFIHRTAHVRLSASSALRWPNAPRLQTLAACTRAAASVAAIAGSCRSPADCPSMHGCQIC